MKFSAQQIAGLLNGVIQGDDSVCVTKLSKIEEGEEGSISFLGNPLYTQHIYNTKASIVIINKDFELTAPVSATLIRVESAQSAFGKLLELYNQVKLNKVGISKLSFISDSATFGENLFRNHYWERLHHSFRHSHRQ